jgi:kynurenine formamidase
MKIIDLSYVIENGMPTCGTPWHENVNIHHLGYLNEVGRNTHALTMGSHTGTHMDAPFHFIEGGRTIEDTPLDVVCG